MIGDSTDHVYTTSRFNFRVGSCSLRMVQDWLSSSAYSDTTDEHLQSTGSKEVFLFIICNVHGAPKVIRFTINS